VTNAKQAGVLGVNIVFTRDQTPISSLITATATKVSNNAETSVTPFDLFFPGLEAGEEYTFTLYDSYQNNDSDDSLPSASLLISDVPAQISSAPTIESVGDQTITISWTAPSSDAPITGYQINIVSPGNTREIFTGSTETTYPVGGLDNGLPYQFAVRALNGLETSSGYAPQNFSDLSDLAVPIPPGAVEVAPDTPEFAPTALAGDASVTLNWTFGDLSSGTANDVPTSIVQYKIYYRVLNTGSYIFLDSINTYLTTGSIVLGTGLTNGTTYEFTYSVVNGNRTTKESGQSPAVSATPEGAPPGELPPGQPEDLDAAYDPTGYPGGGPGVRMTWSSGGGGPVLYYRVFFTGSSNNQAGSSYETNVFSPTTEFVVSADYGSGFETGIYSFSVQAFGPGGSSEAAEYIAP
jgi:hypothetical protein